jgi:hypothetical protein
MPSKVLTRFTGRPEDCDCWDGNAELPCWPCYRDGFEEQNPDEPGAED